MPAAKRKVLKPQRAPRTAAAFAGRAFPLPEAAETPSRLCNELELEMTFRPWRIVFGPRGIVLGTGSALRTWSAFLSRSVHLGTVVLGTVVLWSRRALRPRSVVRSWSIHFWPRGIVLRTRRVARTRRIWFVPRWIVFRARSVGGRTRRIFGTRRIVLRAACVVFWPRRIVHWPCVVASRSIVFRTSRCIRVVACGRAIGRWIVRCACGTGRDCGPALECTRASCGGHRRLSVVRGGA